MVHARGHRPPTDRLHRGRHRAPPPGPPRPGGARPSPFRSCPRPIDGTRSRKPPGSPPRAARSPPPPPRSRPASAAPTRRCASCCSATTPGWDPEASRRSSPPPRAKLSAQQRQRLRRGARLGEPLPALAARLGVAPAAARRVLLGHRAAVALRLPIPPEPAATAGRPPSDGDAPARLVAPLPPGLPAPLAAALSATPPSPAEARRLAAAYRDARTAARVARAGFRPAAPPPQKRLDAFAAAVHEAAAARRRLVAAALPELVSVARRHLPASSPAGPLVALLDAGLPDVLAEADRYDPAGPLPLHRVLRNRLLRTFAREDPLGRAHAATPPTASGTS